MKNGNSKFKIFFVFGLVALIFAVYGYLQAVPFEKSLNNTSPRIVIEPKELDFGEVKFGKVVEQTFEVKNTGDGPLAIKRVSTSCACTKAKVDKEKLEPGETANLLVTYDSGAMGKSIIGEKVERFVYIRSNDSENPQVEVAIKAKVTKKISND